MPPQITVQDLPIPLPPDQSTHILALLSQHLPYSHHVLRRLQFAQHSPAGRTPTAHLLWVTTTTTTTTTTNSSAGGDDFAAAYVDLSRHPETQVFPYATTEDGHPGTLPAPAPAADLLLAVMRRVRGIARAEGAGLGVMFGSLHGGLREAVLLRGGSGGGGGGLRTSYTNVHEKWLLPLGDLPWPGAEDAVREWMAREGMGWGVVEGAEDCRLVISRTRIPKSEATLMTLPSMSVRLKDGTMVAWAFMGVDGTLSTLHVEEPYRGKGLAKALAVRIMRQHHPAFSDDGWCAADVHVDNKQSQGVCKSMGGYIGWRNSWTRFELDTLSDAV
ncbi:uncharacterized protein E0L32_000574 [Thyridium curvatum]|uniref:FR47-like domain-containing protein n=1 Tax=Thyridium curvatum TaxID=1093900 RepID=A0A507BC40_9PEZI|nr:uncharacterized protein E0L32_000574 [Thyridium curvatum]TPX14180.1 hypothetical protein E0L32_000574 [Thyridium curvatum]